MKVRKVLLFVLFMAQAVFPQESGTLAGRVVDEQNRAVPGIPVLYNRIIDFRVDASGSRWPIPPFVNSTVPSGPDGRFTVSKLPPGDYYVCAQPPGPGYLGSCEWNQPILKRTISAGGKLDLTLVIRSGVKVSLRVRDAQGYVASGAKLLVGVMSPEGYYRRAELAVSDSQVRTYVATIPKDARVSLFIHSERPVYDGSTRLANAARSKSIEPESGIREVNVDLDLR